MRVTFVGVGEAFDECLPNTSLFVESSVGGRRRTVLMDCGFTAAAAFFACTAIAPSDRNQGPDALWLSHYHGDHCFGLPYLLARLQEAGRHQPLLVSGGGDVAGNVNALVSMAYPNLLAKLRFPLVPVSVGPDVSFALAGLTGQTAATGHGAPCLALRLTDGEATLYYSGDGTPTETCRRLAAGCDVIVQEAYGLEPGLRGHGSVHEAVAMGGQQATVAIVHLQRDMRREQSRSVLALLEQAPCRAVMPEAGAVITV